MKSNVKNIERCTKICSKTRKLAAGSPHYCSAVHRRRSGYFGSRLQHYPRGLASKRKGTGVQAEIGCNEEARGTKRFSFGPSWS